MITTQTQTAIQPEPGLYPDVPFDQYLRWPHWNKSALSDVQRSPMHGYASKTGQVKLTPTDDMLLGSALHTAFLEPELMPERVVLWDGKRRAGKEWDAFREANANRVILTNGYYAKLQGMVKAMRKHSFVRNWSRRIDEVEVSGVGHVNGLLMKGRCDALTDDPLVDVKKVSNFSIDRFMSYTVKDYLYHVQAYIYCTIFSRDRFVLLCVEDTPPHDVVPIELPGAVLKAGKRDAERLIEQVIECERTGVWPGISDDIVVPDDPWWAAPSDELTHNGQPLNI